MTYRLLHGERVIAEVIPLEQDFPGFYGRYALRPEVGEDPELAHLAAYVEFCLRISPLVDADRTDEIDLDEEARFTDLIESDRWWLLDEEGERTAILVPVFYTGNGISWRLDTDR